MASPPGRADAVGDADNGLFGGVGVRRRRAAVMIGVEGLEKIPGFRPPHLPEDDPIRREPEGLAEQLADLNRGPVHLGEGLRHTRLKPDEVPVLLLEINLRGRLDEDEAFVFRNGVGEGIHDRCLAGAGAS
jgi:hypothetical protein